jgi:predicted phosphodiesterase
MLALPAFVLFAAAFAQPGSDPSLVMHFGTTVGGLRGADLTDASGKVTAVVSGGITKEPLGPSEGYRFDGVDDWLTIADLSILPVRDFTASAWVSINQPKQSGSIIGRIQDDGNVEGGWSLGYNSEHFTFALAGQGAEKGRLTVIEGRTPITPGKWYHVAATYDGVSMSLFVNGVMEAESKAQSGPIRYPAAATPPVPFTIACFKDANQTLPMDGLVQEVKLHSRVLPPSAFTTEVASGARLISYDPPYSQSQKFIVAPYLQAATQTSMLVSWETARPARGYVEYGERLPYDKKSEVGELGTMHHVRLTGLKPETQYFYRVHAVADSAIDNTAGLELIGEPLTLRTAVADDAPFAFVAIGDTQRNPAVIKKLQDFAFTLRPNFEIHLGDVVDEGPDKNEWTKEFFAGSAKLLSRVPIFPCIGNHEQNHSLYYQYFNLPAPEYRYTYNYGNAQFFVVDTNKPVDPSSEQYKWLDEELGKSKAQWKFCYHHHTIWCSDEDDYGDTYKETSTWGDARHRHLAALYEKHGVDIVFNGHVHCYERTWPILGSKIDNRSGVVYITSGGGGGGLESAAPTRTWFQRRTYRGHHLTYVMIHDKTLELQAFDLEGRLFDTMTMTKERPVAK